MFSRELKYFHNENRTHFTEKEYTGEEISLLKGACAPFDMEISGASRRNADYVMCEGGSAQVVTEQGKNLMDKERYITFPDGAASVVGFDLSLLELGKTYTFYTSTPCTFTKISNSPGGYNCAVKWLNGESFASWTFTHTRHSNIPAGNKLYLFIAFNSMNFSTDIGDFEGVDIQIEEGSTLTDYEAFVPDSPSADYPSEITPLIAAGTYKIGTKDARYLIELPDMYSAGVACDKLMFDKISKTARLKREIDPELLDPAKTIEENTQAVLAEPIYTELAVTKSYWVLDNTEVPWKIYGKNLFSTERHAFSSQLRYTHISNNSFKFEGSNASMYEIPGVMFSLNLPAGTYKLTFKKTFKNSVSSNYSPNVIMIRKNSYSGDVISFWYMGGDCENKLDGCVLTLNEDCTKLFFNFYASVREAVFTDYLMLIEDIQLEKGSSATDFEAYNAAPPESLTPSADYPHKIYPAENICIKCVKGETEKSVTIPFSGHGFSLGGEYVCDSLVYDSKTKTAKVISRINAKGLDSAKPLSEQSGVIRETPAITEVYASEGYDFSELKTYQGESTVFAGADFGDGTNGRLNIKVKVKEI